MTQIKGMTTDFFILKYIISGYLLNLCHLRAMRTLYEIGSHLIKYETNDKFKTISKK